MLQIRPLAILVQCVLVACALSVEPVSGSHEVNQVKADFAGRHFTFQEVL